MISVPVSNGELLDKLSILEVKLRHGITEVNEEIDLLINIVEQQWWWKSYFIGIYFQMLKTINDELWDVEDRKRALEQEQCFEEEFIDLARCVYIINDERARVKKLINKYTDSKIFEYKQHREY